jgi:hypothetical protein
MYFLTLSFEIPNAKLHEFNSATDHLKNWPIYSLHNTEVKELKKGFLVFRKWDDENEMNRDTKSHLYENLIGAIKVLGNINSYNVYTAEEKNRNQINTN